MNCQEIKKLLPQYLTEELAGPRHAEITAHLSVCPECRKEVAMYQQMWSLLKDVPAIEPEPGYVSRFWARLGQRQPWYKRLSWQTLLGFWPQPRWGLLQNAHLRRFLLVRLCGFRRGSLRAHSSKPCIWAFCNSPRWAVYSGIVLIFVVGFFGVRALLQPSALAEQMPNEEVEFMESFDLAENYEILQNLDVLIEWDKAQEKRRSSG